MSLPEASLENLELGLLNAKIHNDECESRISKGYVSNTKVSLHNGKGNVKKENVAAQEEEEDEEEEEEDDDDIDAYLLKQSGYSTTIKKPYNQPMAVKEDDDDDDDDDEEEEEEEEEEEDEDDDDITADILKQSGYGDEEEEEDEEEDDDITNDILKQSGYGSMKKQHHSTPKTVVPIKLVSALKGSREKEGTPTRNLSVTWSPDVYDPKPSADTFVRIKKPRLKSDSKKVQELKKNGKPIGKDKGKPSKGSKGGGSSKDKKSKYSNNTRRCYGSFDNDD